MLFFAVQMNGSNHVTLKIAQTAVSSLVDVKAATGTLSAEKVIDAVADYRGRKQFISIPTQA